ncbi:MAG TPA: hypothetical protein VGH67_02545 [Solirubrobacteraceae bacterium]
MSAVDSPQQRPSATGAGSGQSHGASSVRSLPRVPRSPAVIAVLVCVAAAALSAAILPTVPSYDPWSWIVWGREVTDPHMSFIVNGGPSWKPLPMIFTTIYGLLGGAAPTLWVITARIGGLLALWGTWKLTHRLAGGGWLGHFAGLLAAVGILLTGRHDQAWYYYFLHGTSEAILVGVTVWTVDRILDGKHGQAYLLMVAGGLIRPEWWPFLGLYAIWLWLRHPGFRSPGMRVLLVAGLAVQPIGWFVPPWITTGQPFLAATHAADYNGHLGSNVLRSILTRGIRDQLLPALILGVAAVVITWVRERNRVILALGAFVVGWWVVVVGETLDGYPGLERFFLPAAALTTVLGGVGLAELARLAGRLAGRWAGSLRRPIMAVTALILAAACIPFSTTQISVARTDERTAAQGAHLLDSLSRAVAAVGGKHGVLPCPSSFTAVNHSAQTALAWKLGVTLQRVGTSMRAPGVDFIGPHAAQIGGPAHVDPRLTHAETVATAGPWRVVRLTDPRLGSTTCVGGR